jgi:hypothetical protein
VAGFANLVRLVLRTNEQVGELTAHHSRLRELHAWFLKFQGDHRLICRTFCETRELRPDVLGLTLPKGILVVDQTSAEPHVPGEVAIPCDDDHVSIAKPSSRDAPVYKSIRRFIREALDAAASQSSSSPLGRQWDVDRGGRKEGAAVVSHHARPRDHGRASSWYGEISDR